MGLGSRRKLSQTPCLTVMRQAAPFGVWQTRLTAFAFAPADAILPHISDQRLATLVHMHMLSTNHLRPAVPQTCVYRKLDSARREAETR